MTNGIKPRVCYFRDSFLNQFEAQYLEPLQDRFDMTAAYTRSHRYEVNGIQMPLVELPCLDYLNGLIPRSLGGFQVPNIFKYLGYDTVVFGLEKFLPGFDLLHVQEESFYSTWQVARLKDRYGFKMVTVQTLVEPYWYMHRSVIADRAAFVREKTDMFIARSYRGKLALESEGVAPGRIRVIGHGVDLERFQPGPKNEELLREWGIALDRFIILFVGRMVWPKGIFSLANAARLLLREPEMRDLNPLFLMVGDGHERPNLEEHLKTLGIRDSFLFTGKQPYRLLADIHRLADIFVLPSISTRRVFEQFGIVLIESMASGKPVIAGHSGAIDEVVGDAGLLVPPNDSWRLYEALLHLIRDDDLRKYLSECGISRVQNNFTHSIITEKIASAYEEVLAT
jgi:glycosyltransferase involved in cell wall biosynthesis